MHAQGVVSDPAVLDVGEVELVDLKFLEGHPIVVVQFTCQQLNCTRDQFGNVVEGAPDEVQRVYYYWALQQDAAGFVGAQGTEYPPRWQVCRRPVCTVRPCHCARKKVGGFGGLAVEREPLPLQC